jgi:hypothetical protein
LSPREIADGVGKKDTAVRQLLRSMVQDGEVLRHGTSSQTRYTLAEGDHDHHDDHGTHDHHGSTFSWEDEDSGTIIVNFSHLSGGHRAS